MKHFYTFTLVTLSLFVSAQSQAENAGAAPPPPDAEMSASTEIYVLRNEIKNLRKRQEKLEEDNKELEEKLATAERRLEGKFAIMDKSLYKKVSWADVGWWLFVILSAFGMIGFSFIAGSNLAKRIPAPQQK